MKLKQLLSESKKPLNEDITKVLSDVSEVESEKIYDNLTALEEKFFAEQTKRLNNTYKRELQQYVGKVFTDEIISQLGRPNPYDNLPRPKSLVGKKIVSMSFTVQMSYGDLEINLKVELEGGKSVMFLV